MARETRSRDPPLTLSATPARRYLGIEGQHDGGDMVVLDIKDMKHGGRRRDRTCNLSLVSPFGPSVTLCDPVRRDETIQGVSCVATDTDRYLDRSIASAEWHYFGTASSRRQVTAHNWTQAPRGRPE